MYVCTYILYLRIIRKTGNDQEYKRHRLFPYFYTPLLTFFVGKTRASAQTRKIPLTAAHIIIIVLYYYILYCRPTRRQRRSVESRLLLCDLDLCGHTQP